MATTSSLDRIYSQIKSETNKYSDISNVYQKLQDSGQIRTIYELFQQIFVQEKRYTFDEISKVIQANPNRKINLESQLKLNGAIFKSNFHLIVDILIDMISSEVYSTDSNMLMAGSSNTSMSDIAKVEKLGLSQKSLNLSSQKIVSPSSKSPKNIARTMNSSSNRNNSNNNNKVHVTTGHNNNNMMRNIAKERENPRLQSQSAKLPQGLSTSVVVTRNDARAFKKKKQATKGESTNVPLNNMSFFSQKNQRLNQTTNSFYSQSTLYPNLDSEFSYIGGKSTFSFPKTERMKEPKDYSPGPVYDPEKAETMVRTKSPDVKFDKAEKTSWFDERAKAGNQSPGFVYNPSRHFVTK